MKQASSPPELPRWLSTLFDKILLLAVMAFLLLGLYTCLRLFWTNATQPTYADPEAEDVLHLTQE